MKPMEAWEMEAVFIFTGIVILLVGIALGILGATLMDKPKPKQKKSSPRQEKDDPCETCLRWPECNGVDPDCPKK